MIAPVEVAVQSTTAESNKDNKLDELLKTSLQEYGFNILPSYNYAREEELKKDKMMSLMRSDRSNSSKELEVRPLDQQDE